MPRIETPVKRVGNMLQADYFSHIGGMDTASSPMEVDWRTAARGSKNWEYTELGSIRKTNYDTIVNTTADTQVITLAIDLREPINSSTQIIRAAGTKIQAVNIQTVAFTNLTSDDSSPISDFWDAETPVASTMFSTADSDVLWLAGAGAESIYGVYSPTKVTANGVPTPTGSISTTVTGGGSFTSSGSIYYTVAFRKTATQALGNAALDVVATLTTTSNAVTVSLNTVTNVDTTRFDAIYLFASQIDGSSGFTAGRLVTIAPISSTSITDIGGAVDSSVVVPRAGNVLLDNSPLPAGEYQYIASFKRRLVTILNNQVFISDLNKPESWPLHNRFYLPSGGAETGLGVISFNTPTSSNLDELLAIFKEKELRVLTGSGVLDSDGVPDWELKFISKDGASSHKSIVNAEGYLAWINRRGIFIWDGSGKPMYCSRPIEDLWATSGDLNQTDLSSVWGVHRKDKNQIVWCISHAIYGTKKVLLKMDTRLSFQRISSDLSSRIMDGVFLQDTISIDSDVGYTAGAILVPPNGAKEVFLAGDGAVGRLYIVGTSVSNSMMTQGLEYITQFLDQDSPGVQKSYAKVIVWVEGLGNWPLTLDYWADYRNGESNYNQSSVPIGAAQSNTIGIWDLGYWDVAYWDQYEGQPRALVFNLSTDKNNASGDCIRLRFKQTDSEAPVTIRGFSIQYTEAGSIK